MRTVRNYIDAARVLLQDQLGPEYRYPDANIKMGLYLAFVEAYRIRPDMFIKKTIPDIVNAGMTAEVPVPDGYQTAWLYYAVGWCQMQDNEDTQDSRASTMLNKFTAQLLTSAA